MSKNSCNLQYNRACGLFVVRCKIDKNETKSPQKRALQAMPPKTPKSRSQGFQNRSKLDVYGDVVFACLQNRLLEPPGFKMMRQGSKIGPRGGGDSHLPNLMFFFCVGGSRAPRGAKMVPRPLRQASRADFGSIFDRIWMIC